MPLYRRKWNCAVCGKPVIWDSDAQTLSCGCRTAKCTFVNMEAFELLPKYDRKIWKETLTVPIDCAKFLSNEILLDGSQVLFISDRNSIFKGNENPQATLRWIYYPENDKIQLCIAVSGTFHTEKISYNQKDPDNWKERMWIFLNGEQVGKILAYLQRDPQQLASWM